MSAADAYQTYLFDAVRGAIEGISEGDAADIDAFSFWIHELDDDPRRTVIDFNYNTMSQAKRSEGRASGADEARWNFAFWLQNEIVLVGGDRDPTGQRLRGAWLDERGLNFIDDDEEADFDGCLELGEQISDEVWRMSARVGKRLHDAGIIHAKFGRPLPIIIHNLEYYEKVTDVTRAANPDGVADEFLQWVAAL